MPISGVSKKDLHQFIKYRLKGLIEADYRLRQPKITEYTLQAIIWDHISQFVGNFWTLSIEAYIPGTTLKSDIVIYKLSRENEIDMRYGAVAIEVKPDGQIKGISGDLKKLKRYVNLYRSPINFGVMIYLSRQKQVEKKVKGILRRIDSRKIFSIYVHPPKK